MTTYLKMLGDRLLKRLRSEADSVAAIPPSPVVRKSTTTSRPAASTTPPTAPQARLHAGTLPPGSKILSNGNGKNVYAGDLRAADTQEILALLDDPTLSLQEEDAAFDPYNTGTFERSNSWDRISRSRHD